MSGAAGSMFDSTGATKRPRFSPMGRNVLSWSGSRSVASTLLRMAGVEALLALLSPATMIAAHETPTEAGQG